MERNKGHSEGVDVKQRLRKKRGGGDSVGEMRGLILCIPPHVCLCFV